MITNYLIETGLSVLKWFAVGIGILFVSGMALACGMLLYIIIRNLIEEGGKQKHDQRRKNQKRR